MAEENHYDVIMIGSGIGALTAARVLAKLKGKRTLLLEQHTVAGGFTHEFKRPGNLTWDVGIHYMGEGRDPRAIMDFISDGGIQWTRMNEPFERFVYPDFTFELYGEPARFKKDLIGRTAEIVAITDYGAFKRWADRPWMDRGEEYDTLKHRIAAGLLRLVERKFPGFSDLVEYQEVSTPLSVEHFMQSPEGAIYGLAGTPERFRQKWLGVRTPVKNLYLAGSDVYFHGLVGATMGGLAAASAAMGPSSGFSES